MNLRAPMAARRIVAAAAVTCAVAVALGPAAAAAAASTGHLDAPLTTTPSCSTSGLDVWLNTQGNGAAGHTYYLLNFTNLSGSSCRLYGYPGVSAVTLSGGQLGKPASRTGATSHTVTLANGATTHAVVGIVNGGLFPASECHPVTAAGLRVYPPNQFRSKVAPYPFTACSRSGPVYLSIGPVGNG